MGNEEEGEGKDEWPFHPKHIGIAIAAVFLFAYIFTVLYERMLPVPQREFYSELRTFFAVIVGSGFTAWLSMTIYEFITRRAQRRGWKHQFDIDKVREVYGPVYNETRRNLELLTDHLSQVKLGQSHGLLQLQYLSLLVPDHLIQLGRDFEHLANEYNVIIDEVLGKLQNRVRSLANSYLVDIGAPSDSVKSLSGPEARYLLGGKHPDFRRHFAGFLSNIEKICNENQVEVDSSEFEVWLRAQIHAESDSLRLLERRERLISLVKEMIAILEPLIKAPYDL